MPGGLQWELLKRDFPISFALAYTYVASPSSIECPTAMTTLAGGFLVINYHDAGRKGSKSNLDRGRKQKRPSRQTAVNTWRG